MSSRRKRQIGAEEMRSISGLVVVQMSKDDEVDGEEAAWEIMVSHCGRTAWVSGADGSMIGRFSKVFGVDVHRTATEQMRGEGECLFCTHVPAGPVEWDLFRQALLKHYDINVPKDAIRF
jgi:hypothetical protein